MAKIAIVDDSKLARTFTQAALRKLGHTIREIEPTSVFDVLKILRDFSPDLLLMDYLMPACPGASLARACSEDPHLKDLKIITITAHHDDDASERLERMGVVGILHKPFEPQQLVDMVRDALAPNT